MQTEEGRRPEPLTGVHATFRAAAAILFLAACGDDDDDPVNPDASTGFPADAAPVDASSVDECAGVTVEELPYVDGFDVGPMSASIGADGRIDFAFSNIGVGNMLLMSRDEGGWGVPTTPFGPETGGAPRLLAAPDGALHAVWSSSFSKETPNQDLFHATRPSAGASWSEPVNLTAAFESELQRDAFEPAMAIGPDGELVVAYFSQAAADEGPSVAEVRVVEIQDGAVVGDPVTVIPPVGTVGCLGNVGAAFDGDGALHVVGICGDIGLESLEVDAYQAVRRGTTWEDHVMVAPVEQIEIEIAAGGDGVIHAAWKTAPCGDINVCPRLTHAIADSNGFSATQVLTETEPVQLGIALAAGAAGRVAITYGGPDGIYLADSPDGETFAPGCRLLEGPTSVPARVLTIDAAGAVHAIVPDTKAVFHLTVP